MDHLTKLLFLFLFLKNDSMAKLSSQFDACPYSMLRSVMNKRQKAALQLNIQLENAAIREKKEAKREQLRNAKAKETSA